MDPRVWGPKYWDIFFDCAYWYDRSRDATNGASFGHLFGDLVELTLPCSLCREHYAEHVDTAMRRDLESAIKHFKLFEWLYELKRRVVQFLIKQKNENAAKTSQIDATTLSVVRSRHDTLQSGTSSVDDVVFVVYATLLEQFTRASGSALTTSQLRDFFVTLLSCCQLVPALATFVVRARPLLVLCPVGETGASDECVTKTWFRQLVAVFESTTGRDVDDIVYAFFALCSVQTRRRALRFFGSFA